MLLAGSSSAGRKRQRIVTALCAAACGASAAVAACGSDRSTPPFGSSRGAIAGRISAEGVALVGVSVSPVVYFEPACTGPALPVTLQPLAVVTGADGGYAVSLLANGFSSFAGCVRLTLQRPGENTTVTVTKAPVTFVEVGKGEPVTTPFDINWP